MAANPFKKDAFPSFREWEQELVFFSVEQLQAPAYGAWESLAEDDAESARLSCLTIWRMSRTSGIFPQKPRFVRCFRS